MKLSRRGELTGEVMDLAFDSMHKILNKREFTQKQKEPYFRMICRMLVDLRTEFSKQDNRNILGLNSLVERRVKEVVGKVDEEECRKLKIVPPLPTVADKETKPSPAPRGIFDDPVRTRGKRPTKIDTWIRG